LRSKAATRLSNLYGFAHETSSFAGEIKVSMQKKERLKETAV